MHYLKCRWDEVVAEKFWGGSWWWFEYDDDRWVHRQMEQYDSGVCLKYSDEFWHDGYGKLTDQALDFSEMPAPITLTAAEFDAKWADGKHQFP